MRIHVDKIGPDGFDLEAPVSASWLKEALGSGSPFSCHEDGNLRVHLDRVDDVVHVRGRARLRLHAACSRCLGPVDLALDTPIEVTLFPRGQEPLPGPDGVLNADDMGVATYEGEEIDLSNVVHDEVFLELPMSPLCSETCAGLCQFCGQNLNERRCGCEQPQDARWEALRRFRPD